jgi:mannose-1-phosphate guanylyltransferase
MVLAAGRGERMRPLSDLVPKPALPLPGGPLVAWSLRLTAATGARRVVVNTWHLAARMEEAVRRVATALPDVEVVVTRETDLLGTAGGLARARDLGLLGGDGAVLVANGDVVQSLDLRPLLARHDEGVDDVTLALLPHLDPRRWSRVELDLDGHVRAVRPSGPPSSGEVPLLYPGVMMVSRDALDRIPSGRCEVPATLWEPARRAGRLGGVVVSGHWREVGTPAAYREAAVALCGDRSRVAEDARLHPNAAVSTSFIGPGSHIAEGAVVEASVVTAGATVGPGARVSRSVLLGPVHVPADEVVTDEVRTAE